MTELTRTVIAYQQGKAGLQSVFRLTAPLIYYYPIRSRRGSEDECGEFLLFFYHRMVKMLKLFTYQAGKSFEAYLFTCMRFQYTTFIRRRSQQLHCRENHELNKILLPDQEIPPPALPASTIDPETMIMRLKLLCGLQRRRPKALQKRIIVLALLNCDRITDEAIDICAGAADISGATLRRMLSETQLKTSRLQEKFKCIRQRRNQYLVSLLKLQQQYNSCPSAEERARITASLQLAQQRLNLAREQLLSCKPQPLQSHIAEVMGLPRASVHTAINYLRRISDWLDARESQNMPHDMEVTTEIVLSCAYEINHHSAGQRQPAQATGDTTDCTATDNHYSANAGN